MIDSKDSYYEYLEADRIANNKKSKKANIFGDYTFNYLNLMRKLEYYTNCRSDLFAKIYRKYLYARYKQLSVKTGIQIPINTFGKGLGLFHYGSIIVNGSAKFGDYCVIQSGVNISQNVTAGDRVYLAPGAKVNENVEIATGVIIGSNAVVTRSITEPNTTWAGLPAKKISDKGFYPKL